MSSHVVIDTDGNQISKTARVLELVNKSAVTRGDESEKFCNHPSMEESEKGANLINNIWADHSTKRSEPQAKQN